MGRSGVCFYRLLMSSVLILVSVNAGAQGKPEKERIRIGYAARAVTHAIPFLANEGGLFREEGCRSRWCGRPVLCRRWLSFPAIPILLRCRPSC